MIGSSDNSGAVVVGALMCGTECSRFKSRFMLFSLVEIFIFLQAIPARSQYSMLQQLTSKAHNGNQSCAHS